MSFVIATPDLVQSAAQDLAGIRSSLAEAAASAAGPTTGIATAAQDEVSVAIASMFGNFGQEFQALTAQAQTFHQQFVSLMNAGAGAYASAEAANAAQVVLGGEIPSGAQAISNAIASSPIGLGSLPTGGASAAISGLNSFGAAVAAPYQALVSNTVTNLQAIGGTFTANPFPFLHQLANNQIRYAQTIGSSIATGIQNLPAELANLPATVQTGIQGLSTLNPGALLPQLITNQIGDAQTVVTALQNAGTDLVTGLNGLPASFQAAGEALAGGDVQGAVHAIAQGLENVVLPGFQPFNVDIGQLGSPTAPALPVTPLGPLGDLAPILAIPGQMAQNVTNLLPPGSIPAQMSQNFTNVVNALTNFGVTLNPGNFEITFGLPLQFLLDAVGAPANGLSALNSSALAVVTAVQSGEPLGAAAALIGAPGAIANGFLNGQTFISLPTLTVTVTSEGVPVLAIPSVAEIPLGGLLTPLSPVVDNVLGPLPGTQIGGLIPGLLSFGSQLAAVITP
ncbi:PE family protein [Mycobacterium sp. 1245805.9]|uniref:PE family protein n=1 Tax=Mycobacterium sp. 1245805.9 TaxID=1856862 RepID=UPI0009EE581E|nr:PE family protein [Mycobacterium sp. 1245805.9]